MQQSAIPVRPPTVANVYRTIHFTEVAHALTADEQSTVTKLPFPKTA